MVSISSFESITGKGAKAEMDGEKYFVGNKKLIEENNIEIEQIIAEKTNQWSNEAKTVVWFANSKKVIAILAIADQIKSTSPKAIAA
jgi:Cu2+-exporting ATPase